MLNMFPQILLQRMFPIFEFISLFSKQGAQHNWFLWSIYFDFLLFCFVVICDLVHTVETVHGIC